MTFVDNSQNYKWPNFLLGPFLGIESLSVPDSFGSYDYEMELGIFAAFFLCCISSDIQLQVGLPTSLMRYAFEIEKESIGSLQDLLFRCIKLANFQSASISKKKQDEQETVFCVCQTLRYGSGSWMDGSGTFFKLKAPS